MYPHIAELALTNDIKEFIFNELNLLFTVESKLGVVIPGITSHSPSKKVLEEKQEVVQELKEESIKVLDIAELIATAGDL